MKFEAIGYAMPTPLTKREYQRLGVETFLSRGFKVWVLDFTQLLNPDYYKWHQPPDPVDADYIIRF